MLVLRGLPHHRRPGPSYRVVLLARSEEPTAAETTPGDGSPLRHRRHNVDAMMVTPAGPASGRKAIVRHRTGHRDTL